jgi:hypothetical protein
VESIVVTRPLSVSSKMLQAVDITVENHDLRSGIQEGARGVGAEHPAADDDNRAAGHTGNTAQ